MPLQASSVPVFTVGLGDEDIEPEMKTRLRRGGQDSNVVTGNAIGSLFLHKTTRPLKEDGKPDPHPHGHLYIFNRTWAPHENRWQAAQLGDLHLDGRYLEAAFEARLGRRLRGLGYELAPDGKGSWEIVGVPASVTLPAFNSGASFQIRGLDTTASTVTITASATNYSLQQPMTVSVASTPFRRQIARESIWTSTAL